MTIAIWNLPPADLIASGFSSGATRLRSEVQRMRIRECERQLFDGYVDAALMPALSVLKRHEDVDVVPAVALSTWKYPYARLVTVHGLGTEIGSIAYNPDYEQERFICEVVLKEQYKMEPEFKTYEDAEPIDLLETSDDARLLVGADVPTMTLEGRVLDMGQEWFELAAYPMTWGLFAARKGELDPESIRALRDGVLESERQKHVWLQGQETSALGHAFYSDDIRFRLDDLCMAGLTELRQFLFYYDVLDDVRDIPFVYLPDDGREPDEGRKPIV